MSEPQPAETGEIGLKLDDRLPHTGFSRATDRIVLRLGIISSAVWTLLVLAIMTGVFQRHIAGQGTVFVEEIQWHLYAVGIAFAIAFCVANDSHIRVDIATRHMSLRKAAWVEVTGILILLLPYACFVFYNGIHFAYSAYVSGEVSLAPEGLGHRWMIKSFLPIAFALLTAAALSRLSRCIAFLRNPNPAGDAS